VLALRHGSSPGSQRSAPTSRNGFRANLAQSLDHAGGASLADSRHDHGRRTPRRDGRHEVEPGRLTDDRDEPVWTRSARSYSSSATAAATGLGGSGQLPAFGWELSPRKWCTTGPVMGVAP
jgi:hypothetical protein